MVTFFSYRVLVPCTECGESIPLDGPAQEISCAACGSVVTIPATFWNGALAFREYVAEFALAEGQTRGSSTSSGELRMYVRWGPQRPVCSDCDAPLDLTEVRPGHDGDVRCTCGHATPTFPAPEWLRAVEPKAMQLFGVPRAATGVAVAPSPTATRPVQFACTVCGAGLRITSESKRLFTCTYCDSDLYLPDALWRALHPVQKRRAWWVAFA